MHTFNFFTNLNHVFLVLKPNPDVLVPNLNQITLLTHLCPTFDCLGQQ